MAIGGQLVMQRGFKQVSASALLLMPARGGGDGDGGGGVVDYGWDV